MSAAPEAATKESLETYTLTDLTGGVTSVAFSRNGRTLAAGDDEGYAYLCSVSNPK